MSIWKSPIFYFGILLVLAVVGLLVAPFVVNWNGYRDNLETWGRSFTGREVAINGPISVRLFPWPRLEVLDVSIANPQGYSEQAMLTAKRVNVQLALGGLFNGDLQVEAIDLDQPSLFLTRNSDGNGNWIFQLGKSRLLEKVKLEQIKLNDGTVTIRDVGQEFTTVLQHVNGVLSASAVEGPWRVRGSALNNGVPIDITFSSAEWKNDEPFKFGFRVAPSDGDLPAFVFDGTENAGKLLGKIRLEPVVTDDGRQSLDQHFKPLQMQADVTASFRGLKLDKIHIVPADNKDSSTLIEGSADVALDRGIDASLTLSSPRIDLDNLVGGQSLRVWRAGGLMTLLNRVISEFPERLDLTADIDVASLSAAGETLENVKLNTSAQQGAVRIQNLTANLPGRSLLKFDGIAFPGDEAAELGGTLAVESNDTRALVSWLWPEGKSELAKYWNGSRGRLKAQSDVTWSGKRFGFQNLKYELDGEAGTAELAVAIGKLPSVDLQLKSKNLDLDNYVSARGLNILDVPLGASVGNDDAGFDKRISIQANKMHLNGVEAQNVAFDFASSFSGFEIKTLDIGSVEGAGVHGNGLILRGPDGPSGDMKLTVKAENPRGFLRMLGAFPKGPDPRWAAVLGQTDLKADVSVRPGEAEPKVTFGLTGGSGPLQFSASGDVAELNKGRDARLGISAELNSANGGDLARLVGFSPITTEASPGKILLTVNGANVSGFNSVFRSELWGAKIEFEGHYKPSEKLPTFDGAASLSAENGMSFASNVGLAHLNLFDGPIALTTNVSTAEQKLMFSSLAGQMNDQKISGEGSVGEDGAINANIALGPIDISTLLAAEFMPWRNVHANLDEGFSNSVAAGWRGEIWLRPSELHNLDLTLKDAVIGIGFEPGSRSFSIASHDENQEPFIMDLTLRKASEGYVLEGTGHGRVSLTPVLARNGGVAFAGGHVILDGKFQGKGRSPRAVLSDLEGVGTYQLNDAALTEISPNPFYRKLDEAKDAIGLQQAFEDLLKAPGFAIENQKKNIIVSKGLAVGEQVDVKFERATAQISPSFDLSNNQIKTEILVSSNTRSELPELRIRYEGPPGEMIRRSDTSAISAKLGYAFIARDVAELDRVKKEQEKIVADGEAQTQADQVKFAAYQAQRGELRLRLRELKVHAAQRIIDAARLKEKMDKLIDSSTEIDNSEYQRLLQQARGL